MWIPRRVNLQGYDVQQLKGSASLGWSKGWEWRYFWKCVELLVRSLPTKPRSIPSPVSYVICPETPAPCTVLGLLPSCSGKVTDPGAGEGVSVIYFTTWLQRLSPQCLPPAQGNREISGFGLGVRGGIWQKEKSGLERKGVWLSSKAPSLDRCNRPWLAVLLGLPYLSRIRANQLT